MGFFDFYVKQFNALLFFVVYRGSRCMMDSSENEGLR